MKTVKSKTICNEAENLKDIYWYIQGQIQLAKLISEESPFGEEHLQALLVGVEYLQKDIDKIIETGKCVDGLR